MICADNIIAIKDKRRQKICHQRDAEWIRVRLLTLRSMLIDATLLNSPHLEHAVKLIIKEAIIKMENA